MPAFNTITVTRNGQIATITIQSKDRKALTGPHVEIGAAMSELRYDNGVRVVIITGDDAFFLPPKGSPKASGHTPGHDWDLTQGMHRTYQIDHRDREAGDRQGERQRHRLRLEPRVRLRPDRRDRGRGVLRSPSRHGQELQGGRTDFGTVPGDGGTCSCRCTCRRAWRRSISGWRRR